jgi:hypothetical protein
VSLENKNHIVKWIKKLSELGVKQELSSMEQITITLSNFIALSIILIFSILLIFIPINFKIIDFYTAVAFIAAFSFILYLNYIRLYTCNKLLLSWLPPVLITLRMIYIITQVQTEIPAASYGLTP